MAGPTEASTGLGTWPRFALALVAPLALLAYWNSLSGGFVWDDRTLILDGNLGSAWARWGEIFTSDFFYRAEFERSYGYYRPVTTLSYVLDHGLWELRPFGYHVTNVLLHAICSVWVGVILIRLDFDPEPAILAALLFAVHPIHTESVAWISGRTDILAFFFCSLSVLTYLAATKGRRSGEAGAEPNSRRRISGSRGATATRRKFLFGVSTLAFGAALLAKEIAVVLPFWLALIALLQREVSWRVALRQVLPYFGVLLIYLLWRFLVIGVVPPLPSEDHSLARAVLSAPPTIVEYLRRMVSTSDPSAYIQNPYVSSLGDPRLLTSLGILSALLLLCWRPLHRSRKIFLLLGTTALFFAPILNIVRITGPLDMGNVMAERFCYFPSFPLLALLALALCWARKRASRRLGARIAWAGLVLLMLGALAWRTSARNEVWRDEFTFLTETLEASPNATLLWDRLANHHLANGELTAAAAAINTGLKIAPKDYGLQSAKVHWFALSGRAPEAIPLQEELVRHAQQGKPVALNNLAHLYRLAGRTEDSLSILQELVEADSAYADVYANLAGIYHARGQTDLARQHLRRALELQPANRANAESLALVELAAERPEEAVRVYRALLKYYPRDSIILRDLALARARSGELPEALRALRELIKTHPDYVGARVSYADLLRRAGRQREAIVVLREALRLAAGSELEEKLARQLAAWQADAQPD
jgi:tetratricopeptide (TPR) repeat protein